MKKCDSIHILKVYDIYEDRSSKIVVSEFCNMGSLQDEIQKRKRMGTDELKATAILRQIVSALKVNLDPFRISIKIAAFCIKT
jgi:serine/threonine protein kinase